MRYLMFGIALAALSTAATAEDSAWGFFNGGMGAGVQAADGSQLLIKCDMPGKDSVYAVISAKESLAPPLPASRFESDPVTLRMDQNAPWTDNWRFNGNFALAVDKGNTRSLQRLLDKLQNATKFSFQSKQPKDQNIFSTSFNVTGTKDAVSRVFAACKDDNPLANPGVVK